MLEPLNWTKHKNLQLYDAEGPEGRWCMSRTNVTTIGFRPPVPGDFKAYWEEVQNHPGKDKWTEEYQRLYAPMNIGRDFMFAENWTEAKLFIETIRAGDADLAPALDQLREAGFDRKYQHTLPNLWSKKIRYGSLDISFKDDDFDGIYARFHGENCAHWHNVCSITWAQRGYSNPSFISYNILPDNVREPSRVGVKHVLNIMALRLGREKSRFSTPLGGALPAKRH